MGLTRKNGWEGGIWQAYCGPSNKKILCKGQLYLDRVVYNGSNVKVIRLALRTSLRETKQHELTQS